MRKTGDVADYIMEAISLASGHGGAKGEPHISVSKLSEKNADGFMIKFGLGLGAPEHKVMIVRSR